MGTIIKITTVVLLACTICFPLFANDELQNDFLSGRVVTTTDDAGATTGVEFEFDSAPYGQVAGIVKLADLANGKEQLLSTDKGNTVTISSHGRVLFFYVGDYLLDDVSLDEIEENDRYAKLQNRQGQFSEPLRDYTVYVTAVNLHADQFSTIKTAIEAAIEAAGIDGIDFAISCIDCKD